MKSPGPDSPPPTLRRSRRWLRWCAGLLIVAVLAMAVLWQLRLPLVRQALGRALPEFPAQVEGIDWQNGGLELRGLKLAGAKGAETWLELPRAHLSVNPLRLAAGELGEITVEGAKVRLTPEILQQLSQPRAGASQKPPAFQFTGMHVTDAALDVALPSGETAALVLNWQGGAASLNSTGGLQAERQNLTLRQIKLQPNAQTPGASAAEISLEWSADAAQQRLTVHQLKTNQISAQAGAALWQALGLAEAATAPAATGNAVPAGASSPMVALSNLLLEDVAVGPVDVKFQELPWLPKLPPGHGQLSFQARNVNTSLTAGPTSGTVQFALTDFQIGDQGGQALLTLPKLTADAAALPAGGWRVNSFSLLPTALNLTTERLGELGLSGWLPSLEIAGTLSAEAHDFTIQEGVISSDVAQEISLSQVRVQRPGADHALLHWEELTVAGQWEEIFEQKRFRRLQWTKPELDLRGDDLAALQPPIATEPEAVSADLPAWQGWRCDEPRIMDGKIRGQQLGAGIPDFGAGFSLETVASNWDLLLEQLVVLTPGQPKAPPLYRGERVQVEINPAQLWTQRRIERVTLQTSRVHVGVTDADAQAPLTDGETALAPPRLAAAMDLDLGPQPLDWHIGSLELSDTKVHLHNLIPDAPEILIPLAQKMLRNIPLTLEGLKQSDDQQRIELPFVYVPGTRAGTSVADFDTNFIHFTIAGLMQREVELVELVNPKIYVGDSLFHYVDKLRAQKPAVESPVVTELSSLIASMVTVLTDDSVPEGPLVMANPGWKVNRLKAVNGKLITTVKDSPLLRVPPLPFGADSSVREGKINAQLAVPPGLYKPLLGTELVVAISDGSIIFNLPMKQRDNNLVQVFKADWLRYKQFRVDNVTLQVTYDKNGVYALFWAKGYQGDISGAFNLYLDDNLSWDMWLAGTKLETKDITATLTPAYFNMTGPVSGRIIAQGDKTSLYQATGEFANATSGSVKVTALEDAIKAIPADWSEVERKSVIKLLETVRDFNYDKCTGTLRFYGLEGEIHLHLGGPDGARNFDVFSHDRRLSEK